MVVGGGHVELVGQGQALHPVVGADAGVVADVADVEVAEAAVVAQVGGLDPEGVGVAAVEGEHVVGQLGGAPGGGGPQRRGEADTLRDPAELGEVVGPVVELVVDLDAEQFEAPDLLEQGGVPLLDLDEVARIVGADLPVGVGDPVGQSSVAGLGVDVGAEPQEQAEAVAGGEFEEVADVEVAVEGEGAVGVLVMVPEGVGGDVGEAAGAGAAEDVVPQFAGDAGVVDLAGDGEDRLAVDGDEAGVDADAVVAESPQKRKGRGGGADGDGVDGHRVSSVRVRAMGRLRGELSEGRGLALSRQPPRTRRCG